MNKTTPMTHQDRIKEFNKYGSNDNVLGRYLSEAVDFIIGKTDTNTNKDADKRINKWLLTQFKEIDQEWYKKIDNMRHTVHTNCCCNDMLNKLLK